MPTGNCPECGGEGKVRVSHVVDTCVTCDGTGEYYGPRYRCPGCDAWQPGDRSALCFWCEEEVR